MVPKARSAWLAGALGSSGRKWVRYGWLSGGSGPWQSFRLLADEDVAWESVEIFQVDERVAPMGDDDRNLTHMEKSLPADAWARMHPMPVDSADLELRPGLVVAHRLHRQDGALAVMLQLRTLVSLRRVLDRKMRQVEGRAQLVQLVRSRVAQRHPHESRRLTGQPAGIAEAHGHDVLAASHEVSAIDDHDQTMLPVRATALISSGLQSAGGHVGHGGVTPPLGEAPG